MKKIFAFLLCFMPIMAFADDAELLNNAEQVFEATRIVCSGISDEIAKVSNISKANTAVTTVGTVASTGALAAGIAKSNEEKEIERLIAEMCAGNRCAPERIKAMSDEEFMLNILMPKRKMKKSKKIQTAQHNMGSRPTVRQK